VVALGRLDDGADDADRPAVDLHGRVRGEERAVAEDQLDVGDRQARVQDALHDRLGLGPVRSEDRVERAPDVRLDRPAVDRRHALVDEQEAQPGVEDAQADRGGGEDRVEQRARRLGLLVDLRVAHGLGAALGELEGDGHVALAVDAAGIGRQERHDADALLADRHRDDEPGDRAELVPEAALVVGHGRQVGVGQRFVDGRLALGEHRQGTVGVDLPGCSRQRWRSVSSSSSLAGSSCPEESCSSVPSG
jgi:hypothetical protein